MTDTRLALTDRAVSALPFAVSGQYFARDDELPGFAVLVGNRILHVPKPKGGEVKAFDIPLSRAMIGCLVRVMRLGRVLYPTQAVEWLFPADSVSGHLAEHKEDRGT
jgi:hypothetical protein